MNEDLTSCFGSIRRLSVRSKLHLKSSWRCSDSVTDVLIWLPPPSAGRAWRDWAGLLWNPACDRTRSGLVWRRSLCHHVSCWSYRWVKTYSGPLLSRYMTFCDRLLEESLLYGQLNLTQDSQSPKTTANTLVGCLRACLLWSFWCWYHRYGLVLVWP